MVRDRSINGILPSRENQERIKIGGSTAVTISVTTRPALLQRALAVWPSAFLPLIHHDQISAEMMMLFVDLRFNFCECPPSRPPVLRTCDAKHLRWGTAILRQSFICG
jgi:hypothetical protein